MYPVLVEKVMKAFSFTFVKIAIAKIPGVSQKYREKRELSKSH